MKRVTALNAVLADWDEGKTPDGKTKYFSVAFFTKSGEFVYIKRGKRSGLRFNMKDHDMKAVIPVDKKGEDLGHVYPVWIHSILFYRGNVLFNLLGDELNV